MSTTADAQTSLAPMRRMLLSTTLLLVVQFVLGMAVNLFVQIPDDHPGAHPAEYFSGVAQSVSWAIAHSWPWLALHVILGLLLVLGAISILMSAIARRQRRYVAVGVAGFIGIGAAGFNGGSFLNYNENISSMLMAIGFALAVTAYVVGLSLGPGAERQSS